MNQHNKIALIFDFDDTLAPDSTSGFLESLGIKVPAFWERAKNLVQQGWDPVPAYLEMMLDYSRHCPPGRGITRERLETWGRRMRFFPGATGIFDRLKKRVAQSAPEVELEYYLISSGIAAVLRSARIAGSFSDMWASDFAYAEDGEIRALKNVVSFTDKTRFIFQIAKGVVGEAGRRDPFGVNRKVAEEELRIPMDQMIVVGDGFTDIPCFSLVQKAGGVAIGVYDRESRERWGKAWGFIEDRRVTHLVAADYRKGSGLDDALTLALENIARRIHLRRVTYQG